MGEKAYMVTFKHIDPLFVIDLKNPANPTILGKLKIPGYSDYLHPYDENHLIGIGKEVDASIDADKVHTEGAVYYHKITCPIVWDSWERNGWEKRIDFYTWEQVEASGRIPASSATYGLLCDATSNGYIRESDDCNEKDERCP